ncbi:FhaA domain-containing protein [Promineifilum sp.]|uniref:FhaA domain-containing protein n=1 Tax=Promineifilum sp. TaxID=2664178 RepID=UPI0035B25222
MKRSPLSRVESLLRRVVEEPFTWLTGGALDPYQLATYLARAYEAPAADGWPNRFTVYVHPEDYRALAGDQRSVEHQVSEYVSLLLERRGIHLAEAPRVRFEADAGGSPRRARVAAVHDAQPQATDTEIFAVEINDGVMDAIRAVDAFLIVGGRRHVPLDRPLTTIGRRIDNDLVLDTPSISRQHAQIRWRQRYFVLYDTSSHGRTAVNGMPTREHILRPGDVIALSDVMIVYGEGRDDLLSDLPPTDEEIDTTQLKPGE